MRRALQCGLADLIKTARKLPVIAYFTWSDTKARYIRSVLGPLWLVLGTMIGVVGLGVLWTSLFGLDPREYIPSLTIGLVVWQLIAGCLSEAPGLLVRKANLIRNIALPISFFGLESICRQSINFVHNWIIVVGVLLVFPPDTSIPLAALSMLGLLLTLVNLFWICNVLAMVSARFRDLEPLITSVIPLLFFLSPVIFRAEQATFAAAIVWCNPVTYAVNAIREPLLGHTPPASLYLVMCAAAIIGWIAMLLLVGSRGKRIPYLV